MHISLRLRHWSIRCVIRMSPDGSTVNYSFYLLSPAEPNSIAIAANGQIYVRRLGTCELSKRLSGTRRSLSTTARL